MASGSFYIPKQKEQNPLGDDAHFICPKQQTIGVADGVGGWARKGVDPGEYARELIANSVMATLDQPNGTVVDPKEVLNHAFLNTEARGSSTACILTLSGNGGKLCIDHQCSNIDLTVPISWEIPMITRV
ncbi:hypothetical protein CsSME_00039318 [Camellia sinensis var. sinensis]